jgi:hypothetical protein
MKNTLMMVFSLLFFLGSNFARAGDFDWDVAGGVAINDSGTFSIGYGGEGTGEYQLVPKLNLMCTLGIYTFSASSTTVAEGLNINETDIAFLTGLKCYFTDMSDLKPYIFGQVGLSDLIGNESISLYEISQNWSVINPEIDGGVGLNFGLNDSKKIEILIQAKVAKVMYNNGNFTYFPIVIGLRF